MAQHMMKCPICGISFDRNAEPYVMINKMRAAHVGCAKRYAAEKGIALPEIIDPKVSRLCDYCRKAIPKDEAVVLSGFDRFAHKDCKSNDDNREITDKEKLRKFLSELYNLDNSSASLNAKMRQAENMVVKNGFTYSGIRGSLTYFFLVKKNSPENDNYLGIVPYIYEEAKEYYRKIKEANRKNELNKELIKSKPVISQVKVKTIEKNDKISKFSFLDEEGELNE